MTFQETISAYIQERYQITPDFPFKKHPGVQAVFSDRLKSESHRRQIQLLF